MNKHLAQYNVALLERSLDDPAMQGFHDLLGPIHAAGDAAPGFVWRMKGEGEDHALDIHLPGNPRTLVAMTVWESIEHLQAFMAGPHREAFLRRREWFVKGSGKNVCWYVAAGHEPTLQEGIERLWFLERFGPSHYGFPLQHPQAPMEAD